MSHAHRKLTRTWRKQGAFRHGGIWYRWDAGFMNAAVCLDSWKLTIFKRRLDQARYSYTEHPGLTRDTITLKVEYTDQAALLAVVKAANAEAARGCHVATWQCLDCPGQMLGGPGQMLGAGPNIWPIRGTVVRLGAFRLVPGQQAGRMNRPPLIRCPCCNGFATWRTFHLATVLCLCSGCDRAWLLEIAG